MGSKLKSYIFKMLMRLFNVPPVYSLAIGLIYYSSRAVFFLIGLKKKKTDNKKILFVNYPRNKGDALGGDTRINSIIINVLKEKGFDVEVYGKNGIPGTSYVIDIIDQFLGFQIGFTLNVSRHLHAANYYAVIIDSSANFLVFYDRVINVFHYSYRQYAENVPGLSRDFKMIYRKMEKMQLYGAKKALNITVSRSLQNYLQARSSIYTTVIPNCVDTSVFYPDKKLKKKYPVAFIGGYAYYGKGMDIVEKLSNKNRTIHCFSNGSLNTKYVVNHSYLKQEDVPGIMNQVGILVYPSRSETFGLVPLEALACGVPIIMNKVGIGEEIIEVIPEFVVDAAGLSLDDIVREYDKRLTIIKNNYKVYSQKSLSFIEEHGFTRERFARSWVDLIECEL